MDENLKKDLRQRIEKANPLELTIINHEIILIYIDAGEYENARAALAELHAALNMDVEFSRDLGNLYLYINKCLIHGAMKRDKPARDSLLDECRKIITNLMDAWKQLAAMGNTASANPANASQRIFAGLTYGRDGQLVEYEDFDPDKGYKA